MDIERPGSTAVKVKGAETVRMIEQSVVMRKNIGPL
jgi:hypothetical protein